MKNSHKYLGLRFLKHNDSKPLLLLMSRATRTPEELNSTSPGKYFCGFGFGFIFLHPASEKTVHITIKDDRSSVCTKSV